MKKVLLTAAGFAALAVSVPASAQVGEILRQGVESILGGGNEYRGGTTERQLMQLNSEIRAGYQRGQISQREASRLQDELRSIAQREQDYRSGGLSRAESDDLERRIQMVRSRIQQANYSNGNWNDRDDRDDRDDRRWNDRDGRDDDDDDDDDDRYDRRDRDRDRDRWANNDRRNSQTWCPPGLERKNNGCQPPGQANKGDRYNNQYGPVPTSYGQRYRDTSRYYYRYIDGRIYQIDRRTNIVVNVTSAPRRR